MFSKTAEYALRATIYIAQKSADGRKLGIEEVADSIDAPRSFTAKILQLLTKDNKIIGSIRGPNGGFFMKAAVRKYSIRKVLETIGEDDVFTKCVLGLKDCSEKQPCPMHFQYKPIKQQMIRLFERKTIQELANDMESGKGFLAIKRSSRTSRS